MTTKDNFLRKGTLGIKWKDAKTSIRGNGRCIVVIPVYKKVDALSKFEEKSIEQVIKILGQTYELSLLCGYSFDVREYSDRFNYDFSYCKCSDDFFKSQKSYSDLCEKYEFYEIFSGYEYILIYQPDAWIFENRLEYFIDLGYDYIGAIHMLKANGNGGRIGNGGFSLRKPKKLSEVCKDTDFEQFRFSLYEDCAFSIRLKSKLNIPDPDIGFEFGWQEHPEAAYKKTSKLPMGCHNPMRNNWNFWRNYISISNKEFDENRAKAIVGDKDFSVKPKYTSNVIKKKVIKKIDF